MVPPPPRSTLFPYTTLFRSEIVRYESVWEPLQEMLPEGMRTPIAMSSDPPPGHALRFHSTAWRDRKSTRLNSSHPSISYAVFCLKKKKKYTHAQNTPHGKPA